MSDEGAWSHAMEEKVLSWNLAICSSLYHSCTVLPCVGVIVAVVCSFVSRATVIHVYIFRHI